MERRLSGLWVRATFQSPEKVSRRGELARPQGGFCFSAPFPVSGRLHRSNSSFAQKTLITTTLAATLGTGIFEFRQATGLRGQVQTLLQRQASLSEHAQRF